MSIWLGGPTVSRVSLCLRVLLGASAIVGVGVWKATIRPHAAPSPTPTAQIPYRTGAGQFDGYYSPSPGVSLPLFPTPTPPPADVPYEEPRPKPRNENERLAQAVEDGEVQAARAALRKGADPNPPTERTSPLSCAARNGDLEMAKLLLHHGANVNPKRDQPPLAWASYADRNRLPMMRLLIRAGADVNARFGDDNGTTVLSVARYHGGDEAVALLKKAGAWRWPK